MNIFSKIELYCQARGAEVGMSAIEYMEKHACLCRDDLLNLEQNLNKIPEPWKEIVSKRVIEVRQQDSIDGETGSD